MTQKVIFLFSLVLLSFSLSAEKEVAKIDYIELGAHNVRQNSQGEYLVDIYANNKKAIAGVQIELPNNNFTLIDISGGRSQNSGFVFHIGKEKGVALAFSMQGKKVSPTHSVDKRINTLFTMKLKKNIKEATTFDIKTLIAGERGTKLESKFKPIPID